MTKALTHYVWMASARPICCLPSLESHLTEIEPRVLLQAWVPRKSRGADGRPILGPGAAASQARARSSPAGRKAPKVTHERKPLCSPHLYWPLLHPHIARFSPACASQNKHFLCYSGGSAQVTRHKSYLNVLFCSSSGVVSGSQNDLGGPLRAENPSARKAVYEFPVTAVANRHKLGSLK